MKKPTNYPYTEADVQRAFDKLSLGLFERPATKAPTTSPPKMLVVAGVQGSGKTYLLENTLLPSGDYESCVRLYLPTFRKLHPDYDAMQTHGVLHAYEHTEDFIRDLCGKIFHYAFKLKYDIIMECALDDINFVKVPDMVLDVPYQFDVHLIACKREFAHISTIKRALKSLTDETLERFVDITAIDASMGNAQAILNSFENACMRVPGSKLTMYERGLGVLKDRRTLCSSVCNDKQELQPQSITDDEGAVITPQQNTVRIIRTPALNTPCSYPSYATIVNTPIETPAERGEMLKECHVAMAGASKHGDNVHYSVFTDLYTYITKNAYPHEGIYSGPSLKQL